MPVRKLFIRDPQARARLELKRRIEKEAQYYGQLIRKRLTRLGLCYRYRKSEDDFLKKNVQEVQFARAVGTPEAIYLMVDTLRLPRKVKVHDFTDWQILKDLSVACGREVRFRYKTGHGAWFVVNRGQGHWGVPRNLPFSDVLENWPESSRKKLLVPLGVGENRKLVYRSLAQFPHALVGGATGAGKSTFLHSWICSLIRYNEPEELRLALIDLKGGVEFGFYRDLDHLIDNDLIGSDVLEERAALIKTADDVIPLLSWLQKQMDERLMRFEKREVQNLAVWNYRRSKHRLPRLVLFIDELAVVMLDSDLKSRAESLLADLTARGRAPGIHVVLATQRPEVKVVPGLVKGNIDARFAFRVTDNASSMVILDSTEASRFDDATPPGRLIYRSGLEKEEIQAPLITAGQIKEIVRDVLAGEETEVSRMTPEEIFRFSIEQLGGSFSLRGMYDSLHAAGHDVSRSYLERLGKEYEEEVVEIAGEFYELEPSDGGAKPRQFVPAGQNGRSDTQDIEHLT
jgi:hypothetical protein